VTSYSKHGFLVYGICLLALPSSTTAATTSMTVATSMASGTVSLSENTFYISLEFNIYAIYLIMLTFLYVLYLAVKFLYKEIRRQVRHLLAADEYRNHIFLYVIRASFTRDVQAQSQTSYLMRPNRFHWLGPNWNPIGETKENLVTSNLRAHLVSGEVQTRGYRDSELYLSITDAKLLADHVQRSSR
jgi:hypothetical protein